MDIPVILAARNEQNHIAASLDALARQDHSVEPIVVINGGSDRTADIAREMGATLLESAEGKMPALQTGLRHLGKRALEPLLILDADSRPFTQAWSGHMRGKIEDSPIGRPAMVWGPYVYSGEINPLLGVLFTGTTMRVSWADRFKEKPRTIRGGNTGLYIRQDELLEEMLALENYWPREDVAIFDTMKKHEADHEVTFNPNGWVLTSGYRVAETLRKIIKERRHPSLVMDNSYASEAPAGSRPYNSETTATVKH